MKFNVLIRTYLVQNLYTSLFDIPNKIDYNNVEILIHNDNPESVKEFNIIVKEFKSKYPNYLFNVIQEDVNQHMFMSYMNSIEYLNADNYWTMVLDDDDTFCKIDEDFINFLNDDSIKNKFVRYAIFTINNSTKKESSFIYHHIYPTYALKNILKYKRDIIHLLLKHNKSTKFSTLEDKLMFNIIKTITDLLIAYYKKPLVNYHKYEHNVNGYESKPNINNYLKNNTIIHFIITKLKILLNQYETILQR